MLSGFELYSRWVPLIIGILVGYKLLKVFHTSGKNFKKIKINQPHHTYF